MTTQCFALHIALQLLRVLALELIGLSGNLLVANMHDVFCDVITMQNVNFSVTTSRMYVNWNQPVNIACQAALDMSAYHGYLHINASFGPSELDMRLSGGHGCESAASSLHACHIGNAIYMVQITPENEFLSRLLGGARQHNSKRASRYVCLVVLPALQRALREHRLRPLLPPPTREVAAVSLQDVVLFRAVRNAVAKLHSHSDVLVNAVFVGDTTLRFTVAFDRAEYLFHRWYAHRKYTPSSSLPTNDVHEQVGDSVQGQVLQTNSAVKLNSVHSALEHFVMNGAASVLFNANTTITIDVAFTDLQCSVLDGRCTVPLVSGVTVHNVHVDGAGDTGKIVTNIVGPHLANFMTAAIGEYMSRATNDRRRFSFAMHPHVARTASPPLLFALMWCLVSFALTVWLVRCSVLQHQLSPSVDCVHAKPLGLRRVMVEDTLYCSAVFTCMFAFMWSNTTTASSVLVGGELNVYVFSLSNTVLDMWNAGLRPLAVLVLVFSGIYPYIKLLCMLFFTVGVQRPHSPALQIIDMLGKLSLLDMYVMLMMIGGLQIRGVADIYVHSSFYVFVCATICSMALGNYATHLWRYGTNIRTAVALDGRTHETTSTSSLSCASQDALVVRDESAVRQCRRRVRVYEANTYDVTQLTRTVASVVCVFCSVPAWVWACVRFDVNGYTSFITQRCKDISLYDLSTGAGALCFVVTVITVLVAPLAYTMTRGAHTWLASWCAVDVFLVACVAGLLQLGQFVQFIVGSNMSGVYSAKTRLLWPLLLLCVVAILVLVSSTRSLVAHYKQHRSL